jgi:diguanylate cyclase
VIAVVSASEARLKRTAPGFRRLSHDHRLSLIVLVSTLTVLFVGPFAAIRFIRGEILVGVADTIFVVVSISAATYAWRTGETYGAGVVQASVLTIGAVVVPHLIGLDGALWLFPIILFVFYLVPPSLSLILTVLALASPIIRELAIPGAVFASTGQLWAFLAAGTSTTAFSFFFAQQSNRQREQLIAWATRDPLTGLYNRRALDEELVMALAARDRHGTSFGLIILDLDGFKEINDRWGHAEGDRVLVELAGLISASSRATDRAFRYGGDEFVLILPGIDENGLQRFSDNLVQGISRSLAVANTSVSASIGAALLLPDDTVEDWNRRADRNLYAAKAGGRNRAVVGGTDGISPPADPAPVG